MTRHGSPALPRSARDTVSAAVVLSATANVIMQLARPAVGYGVLESRVDSGNIMLHPGHRFRTTNTYLAVAMLGTERDVRDYRRAVGRSHARVRSTVDSPVRYDAFDPELQMWVAACLVRAFEDSWALLQGSPGMRLPDPVYRECATLGTSLQVRPEQWPADRDAFEDYWTAACEHVHIDDTMRDYLWRLIRHDYLHPVLRHAVRGGEFLTAGFLHEPFRSMMGFSWDDGDQRRFERGMRRVGSVLRRLPRPVREMPYSGSLLDLRVRRALGRPLV